MALESYSSELVQDQTYIQMIASLFLKYVDQDSLNSVAKEINSMFIQFDSKAIYVHEKLEKDKKEAENQK